MTSVIQEVDAGGTTGLASVPVSFPAAGAGNTLYVAHHFNANVTSYVTPADWTLVLAQPVGGGTWLHQVILTKVAAGGETGVTLDCGSTTFQGAKYIEFDGEFEVGETEGQGESGAATSTTLDETDTLQDVNHLAIAAFSRGNLNGAWGTVEAGWNDEGGPDRTLVAWKEHTGTAGEDITQTWAAASGSASTLVTFDEVPGGSPTDPSGVVAVSGDKEATVTWTDGSGDPTPTWDVEYRLDGGTWTAACTDLAQGTETCTQGGLTNGSIIQFRVRGQNTEGDSAWVESNYVEVYAYGTGVYVGDTRPETFRVGAQTPEALYAGGTLIWPVIPVLQAPPMRLWNILPWNVSAHNTDAGVAALARSDVNPAAAYDSLWHPGQTSFPWSALAASKTFGERCEEQAGDEYPVGGYQQGTQIDQVMVDSLGNSNAALNVYEAELLEQDMNTQGRCLTQLWCPYWYYESGTGDGNEEATGGRLLSGVSDSQTTILVEPTVDIPSGAPSTWPYYASTAGAATYSKGVEAAVSWLMIDNPSSPGEGEIVRIDGVLDQTTQIALTVVRGYWNTTAAARSAGVRVLCPVYVGGFEFMGAPGGYPGSADAGDPTRYVGRIQDADWQSWKAGRLNDIWDNEDGPDFPNIGHLDISSGLGYNSSDWGAELSGTWPVKPEWWDPSIDEPSDRDARTEWQLVKFDGLTTALAVEGYTDIQLQANNLSPSGPVDYDSNLTFLSDPRCPPRVTFEFWLQDAGLAENEYQIGLMIAQANTPDGPTVLLWPKMELGSGPSGYANGTTYRRFTYGVFNLAASLATPWLQFGMEDMSAESLATTTAAVLGEPNQLFRVPLGAAKGTPSSFADLAAAYTAGRGYGGISGADLDSVFRRDFTQGIVVVNNTDASYNFTIPAGNWWKFDETDVAQVSGTVAVSSYDALFLATPDTQ